MKRWQIILVAVIAFLGISLAAGYRLGVQKLQSTVIDALGPGSRVTQFKVNWFTIELFGLSIDAPKGWPTARTLESEHVTIVPDLRSLFSDKIRIASIVVEKTLFVHAAHPGEVGHGSQPDRIQEPKK